MIDYQKILNQNMVKVLKEVLENIKKNGLKNGNHLYITFLTNHKYVEIPKWLTDSYPKEMTIIIEYEYYNLEINDDFFLITLSFNNIKADLKIGFDSIISFADPSANFGLRFNLDIPNEKNDKSNVENKDNIINFAKFKKN